MECDKCPLGKRDPKIRRQAKFEHKLRFVMMCPPTDYVDIEGMEANTVRLLKRWVPDTPFDLVFVLNCTGGRFLRRSEEEHLPQIAKTFRESSKCCSSTFKADLEGAEVVVLMGNEVLSAMGIPKKVSALTGWVEEEKGVSYLATWDPHDVESYPMDKWKDFIWTVQQAERIVNGEAPRSNVSLDLEWTDIRSVESFEQYVGNIPDNVVVSCDLETAGLDYWDIEQPILQIGIWDINGEQPSGIIGPECFNDPAFPDAWNKFVERIRLLGQNHKFDYCYMKSQIPGTEFPIHYDLRAIHHLIDERTGTHDLGRMLQVYLNWKDYWSELERFLKMSGGYSNAPYKELADYLAKDLVGAGLLFKLFISMLTPSRDQKRYSWPLLMSQKDQIEKVYKPLMNSLADIELRGSRIDRNALLKLKDEYAPRVEAQRDKIEAEISALAGGKHYSVDSPSQLLEGLKDINILSKSVTSVKKRVLGDHMSHELVREILSYRSDKKLLDAFIEGSLTKCVIFSADDVRLMSKFDPFATIGSRWASKYPNLQQLPKKGPVKKIFVPSKPGMIIVQDDFSALEARVAAFLSGDEALRDGCIGDLHKMVAERSFAKYFRELERVTSERDLEKLLKSEGLLVPALKAYQALGGKANLEEGIKITKDHLRNCAKVITYGIFFGRGAKALAIQELRCSVEEAEFFIQEYFKLFPKLEAWIKEVHRIVEQYGLIEEPSGLVRDLRGWMFSADPAINRRFLAEAKRKAVNFMTQTFGGTIQNIAFARTDAYLRQHGIGEMRKGVHDSMVSEQLLNSDTRYHLVEARKLHKVIKNPDWLCVTETECGFNYGDMSSEEKFFKSLKQ